ncbi:MAG TPA: FTR1 family protein [Longilinea sp.]|nr:FTR1 family protein [Longilinea sp.]
MIFQRNIARLFFLVILAMALSAFSPLPFCMLNDRKLLTHGFSLSLNIFPDLAVILNQTRTKLVSPISFNSVAAGGDEQVSTTQDVSTVHTSLPVESQKGSNAKVLSAQNTQIAAIGSAGILVFREGLEAVIILASLMASMKAGPARKYRRPMWFGGGLGLLATVVTFFLAQSVMAALEPYGEKLEAVVSMIAIGALLMVTNWFFHKSYWTDWITSMQTRKKRLFSGEAGLMLGLVSLGFATVYREGFETVLFLQALMLESGALSVLGGILAGLTATFLVGFITFKLNARVPYKQMLVFTGVLIGGVLLVMVGKTVHVLQEIGWLPTTLLSLISLPHWLGTWFGTYATWQGIGFQVAAAGFVIGSYYLAKGMRKGKSQPISSPNTENHRVKRSFRLERKTEEQ